MQCLGYTLLFTISTLTDTCLKLPNANAYKHVPSWGREFKYTIDPRLLNMTDLCRKQVHSRSPLLLHLCDVKEDQKLNQVNVGHIWLCWQPRFTYNVTVMITTHRNVHRKIPIHLWIFLGWTSLYPTLLSQHFCRISSLVCQESCDWFELVETWSNAQKYEPFVGWLTNLHQLLSLKRGEKQFGKKRALFG